jgi:hypothetical protein
MSSTLTSQGINEANNAFVQRLIELKQSSIPFYSSGPSVKTDMDVFPYTRFYRGGRSDQPYIMEREAGWRELRNKCYDVPVVSQDKKLYPNHCFQSAPSTTYPCYPETLRKYSDKDALQLQLLRKSINEYR